VLLFDSGPQLALEDPFYDLDCGYLPVIVDLSLPEVVQTYPTL